jgi:hypothetical protein
MEFFLFFGGVAALSVYVVWRRQRRLRGDLEAQRHGLPDDQRDKNVGMIGLPNQGRPWGGGGR